MYVVPSTLEDARIMAETMTDADMKEWLAVNPKGSLKDMCIDAVVRQYTDDSSVCLTLRSDSGVPILFGGWNRGDGSVWVACSVHAERCPLGVLRHLKRSLENAFVFNSVLHNMVMTTNTQHVKLLERLGATFIGPIEPINGEPFQRFAFFKSDRKEE